jgi:hypothetical protein
MPSSMMNPSSSNGGSSQSSSSGSSSQISQTNPSSVPEDNCEKCQYCNIEGSLDCPSIAQRWDTPFGINYNVRTSSTEYPYEVRTLWAQDALQQCIFDEDMPEGECVSNVAQTFQVTCPEAPDNMKMTGGVPSAKIEYMVGCYASSDVSADSCAEKPDCSKSCKVDCLYCAKPRDFVFNVTTYKALPTVDWCDLYLWYNTSQGEWCSILPAPDNGCIAPAYRQIKTTLAGNYRMGPDPPVSTDTLSVFPVKNLIGPGVYKWNVHCYSSILVDATGENDWIKRVDCS